MNKEYIEREALIKEFDENKPENWTNSEAEMQEQFDHSFYRVLVESALAVDVVPVRHGEWLPYPSDAYMKCSVCGMEYHKSRMPDVVGYCPNPNCGAKMDGEAK